MRKSFKYLAFSMGLLACALFCQSCLDDEEDSAVMESILGAYSTLGTVVDTEDILVESDSYGLLSPVNKADFVGYADSVGQRVLMEMNFVEQDPVYANDSILPVKVLRLYKVLSKNADDVRDMASDMSEEYGSDPVRISAVSLGKSYLNIQFHILGYDQNIAHRISLLLTDETTIDPDGLVRVELRHSLEGDREQEPFWGVVSFKLSSIPECGDPAFKGFRIVCDNGSSVQEVTVTRSTPNGSVRAAGYVRPLGNAR
ncbi:MAG TPA: hypothetical protein H9752_11215 [Candidatus Phocaeicola excrementigallinarum]|nr:hypothetical protein [Candidatus Phocaeicola excrementigallinarum]